MSRNPHYIKMINSNKWKLLRAKKLQSNPVCEVCEANNRSTLATEVHHTVPVESVPHELGMRQLMFDYNNLQSQVMRIFSYICTIFKFNSYE